MRSLTWAEVVLGLGAMLQTVALAWIAKRGVVLPPVNRRKSARDPRPPKKTD